MQSSSASAAMLRIAYDEPAPRKSFRAFRKLNANVVRFIASHDVLDTQGHALPEGQTLARVVRYTSDPRDIRVVVNYIGSYRRIEDRPAKRTARIIMQDGLHIGGREIVS